MKKAKLLVSAGALAGMLAPTISVAGATRSEQALPSAQIAAKAPVSSVRTSKSLKHKSDLASSSFVIGALAIAAVAGGIVAVASGDDESGNADSPG